MDKYGVLIVNESAVMRRQIGALIAQQEQLFVIGKARNGNDMYEKIVRLQPSLIIVTYEVFQQQYVRERLEAEGISFIIVYDYDIPADIVANAFSSVMKEALMTLNQQDELLASWLQAAQQQRIIVERVITVERQAPLEVFTGQSEQKQLLIIGSSTGGPSALQQIVTQFEHNLNIPIVIIQHMPIGFTASLAKRLHAVCQLHVKEAEHNEVLQRGTIYIAPAGYQLLLEQNEAYHYVAQLQLGEGKVYKPSIDITLLSLSVQMYCETVVVMLTGMGSDGLRGCTKLKEYGGTLLAEAEETCVVYGMPRVVAEAGLVDKQVPLYDMFDEIMYYLQQE